MIELTKLEHLYLDYTDFSDKSRHVFMHLPRLETLSLCSTFISNATLDILSIAPCQASLQHLNLGKTDIDDQGIRKLTGNEQGLSY